MKSYRQGVTDGYQYTVNKYRNMVNTEYHAGIERGQQLRKMANAGELPDGISFAFGEVSGYWFPEMGGGMDHAR